MISNQSQSLCSLTCPDLVQTDGWLGLGWRAPRPGWWLLTASCRLEGLSAEVSMVAERLWVEGVV